MTFLRRRNTRSSGIIWALQLLPWWNLVKDLFLKGTYACSMCWFLGVIAQMLDSLGSYRIGYPPVGRDRPFISLQEVVLSVVVIFHMINSPVRSPNRKVGSPSAAREQQGNVLGVLARPMETLGPFGITCVLRVFVNRVEEGACGGSTLHLHCPPIFTALLKPSFNFISRLAGVTK